LFIGLCSEFLFGMRAPIDILCYKCHCWCSFVERSLEEGIPTNRNITKKLLLPVFVRFSVKMIV